jgi:hypothetical protein
MAAGKSKTKSTNISLFKKKSKVSRPGVHSKTKTSKSKNSKNYKKTYRGQG